MLFDLQYDAGTVLSVVCLDAGTWAQSTYRRWGLYVEAGVLYLQTYEGTAEQRVSLLSLRTAVWYRAVLQIGGSGEFVVSVWERDNPAVSAQRREVRGTAWAGKSWHYVAQMHTGVLSVDNYDEVTVQSTRYAYDALDNLTVVTDTVGNVSTMTYDWLGRKKEMSDADMGHWTYQYDLAGNLTLQTDNRGCTVDMDYDELNRMTAKTHGGPGACGTMPSVGYTYDVGAWGKGRRTGMSDASGSAAWTYDARGRVTREDKTISGVDLYTTQYSYDDMDRVATMDLPSR